MRFTISLAAALLCVQSFIRTQESPPKEPLSPMHIIGIKKRPDLGAEYGRVARLKLASHKTTYHIGEIISVDVAIINTTTEPIFFKRTSNVELRAFNKTNEIKILPYLLLDEVELPEQYQLLQPREFASSSLQVLVGCDKRAFENRDKLLKEGTTGEQAFENNLFVNWGRACLNVTEAGKYILKAEQINKEVILTAKDSDVKTAVGLIHSTSLTITVMK
jgi:hypothetical protein